jgi:hypothetical protein
MFRTYWNEYKLWIKQQWKSAWFVLRDAIIIFISALYTWIYSILGSVFMGLWKLVLSPMIEYIKQKFIDWFERI